MSDNNNSIRIEGTNSPIFESVKNLFISNFEEEREASAQLCVYVKGKRVLDLCGSINDPLYGLDTIQNIFDSSQNMAAIAIASLVDRQLLKYDHRVSYYWPEFANNGHDPVKDKITIADVLRHESGIPYLMTQKLDINQCMTGKIKENAIGKLIQEEVLNFPPDSIETKRQYHEYTRGFILNEIFRRVDKPGGRTIGEWIKEEIADKYDIQVYQGVPAIYNHKNTGYSLNYFMKNQS